MLGARKQAKLSMYNHSALIVACVKAGEVVLANPNWHNGPGSSHRELAVDAGIRLLAWERFLYSACNLGLAVFTYTTERAANV